MLAWPLRLEGKGLGKEDVAFRDGEEEVDGKGEEKDSDRRQT